MKTYLVGGAVRDRLLGLPRTAETERDWVVVGSTPAKMRSRGFKQVGRDFPVFLHPKSGEEYALARTERKTGEGHQGFVCRASPDVTLEEDLARRDLTINAIAEDADGALVDPYGGQRDITARLLRHVSPAFAEDPLRVFRVARFAAQLPGFTVHDDTLALMKTMRGELPALSGERVWQELARAAATPHFERFFEVVAALAGGHWFDEWRLGALIDLHRRCRFPRRDCALSAAGWVNGLEAVTEVYDRLHAPRAVYRGAKAIAKHGTILADAENPAPLLLDALHGIEAFRQGDLAALVLDTVDACAGTSTAKLRDLSGELRELRVSAASGPDYGRLLRQRRIEHIERWQQAQKERNAQRANEE